MKINDGDDDDNDDDDGDHDDDIDDFGFDGVDGDDADGDGGDGGGGGGDGSDNCVHFHTHPRHQRRDAHDHFTLAIRNRTDSASFGSRHFLASSNSRSMEPSEPTPPPRALPPSSTS